MLVNNKSKNPYFIQQLEKQRGNDVVLFGIDGMSYFGKLIRIEEYKTAVLYPSSLSSSGLVEILNPAEIGAGENRSKVDVFSLVGFGYDITADPFEMPDDNAEDIDIGTNSALPNQVADRFGNNSGSNSLKTLATLGGFLFAGTVEYSYRDVAKLSIEYIFAPGGDGSTLFSINKAIINLDALTSVSS